MHSTIQKITSTFLMLTAFGHFFCCVLPLVATFTSLAATAGLVAINSPMIQWFESHEVQIFIIAGLMILVSGIIQFVSEKIDCHDTGCVHEPCAPKKNWSHKLFVASTILYSVNLVVFLSLPHAH